VNTGTALEKVASVRGNEGENGTENRVSDIKRHYPVLFGNICPSRPPYPSPRNQ